MNADTKREIENFVLSKRLEEVNDPTNLQFLAQLIVDHQHLGEVLSTEPDKRKRHQKLDAMRAGLRFKPHSAEWYELPLQDRGYVYIPCQR